MHIFLKILMCVFLPVINKLSAFIKIQAFNL